MTHMRHRISCKRQRRTEHAAIGLTVSGLNVGVLFQLRSLLAIVSLIFIARSRSQSRTSTAFSKPCSRFSLPRRSFRRAILWARPWLFSIGLLDVARLPKQSHPAMAIDAQRPCLSRFLAFRIELAVRRICSLKALRKIGNRARNCKVIALIF
jgi:hypothetical protein